MKTQGPSLQTLDKKCVWGGRVSTPCGVEFRPPSALLAPVHTAKNQHNYTASLSNFRVGNENQKDMMSKKCSPLFCFYKSNPVCKHFIVLLLVPAFRQLRHVILNNLYFLFVFIFLFCNTFHFFQIVSVAYYTQESNNKPHRPKPEH